MEEQIYTLAQTVKSMWCPVSSSASVRILSEINLILTCHSHFPTFVNIFPFCFGPNVSNFSTLYVRNLHYCLGPFAHYALHIIRKCYSSSPSAIKLFFINKWQKIFRNITNLIQKHCCYSNCATCVCISISALSHM